ILRAAAPLAQIGEPETAGLVEDDIVRAVERNTVALGIELLDLAGLEVHTLDTSARIILRDIARKEKPVAIMPLEAAIVADVAGAIGANGRAVRTAAGLRDDLLLSVRRNARQRSPRNFDKQDASIRHGNRTFGKLQPV